MRKVRILRILKILNEFFQSGYYEERFSASKCRAHNTKSARLGVMSLALGLLGGNNRALAAKK